jgi:hypothetical protein
MAADHAMQQLEILGFLQFLLHRIPIWAVSLMVEYHGDHFREGW